MKLKSEQKSYTTVVDDDGYLEIPTEILKALKWKEGTVLYFYENIEGGNEIYISDEEKMQDSDGSLFKIICNEDGTPATATVLITPENNGFSKTAEKNPTETRDELSVLPGTTVSDKK